jgi:hypothetical protein
VWYVSILPATKMQLTGTATADCLRAGLTVEFDAEIDSHGAIQGKIDAISVSTPSKDKQMGLSLSDADSSFGANAADDPDKPAKPAKSAKSAKGTKPAKGTGRGGKASRTVAPGNYHVVGQLLVGRGNARSVKVPGHGPFPFTLAEQAKISVDMTDLSLARPGQEMSVKGFVSPRQPNIVQAAEVKVKLPEVQAADKKDPAVKPAAKKPAKQPKKDKDEGLPDAGPAL